jgi:predicted transcriptional regulator of viral defense system
MHNRDAKVRLGEIAGHQWGRVKWAQILGLGVDRRTINDWKRHGYIHPVLPGVYAVGHRAPSYEADLAAALLYAGPGAALSHGTAADWLGLLDIRSRIVHVSSPHRRRSQRGIHVHSRRHHDRILHNGFPLTALPQLFLDLAATQSLRTVRKALANADYQNRLNVKAVEAALGRGRAGAGRLRQALVEHEPRLARTKSRLEVAFLELCESAGIPLPEVNVRVAGWEVDALFRDPGVAVELDGYGNHRSPAQVKRDRRKELALRSAGLLPVRYSDEQLDQGHEVIAEIRRLTAHRPGIAQNSSVWP